ncbi:hypothetical protein [Amycolatopsis solani]|uniref:hypothetical protein n=1 Tax=Amycolatopsis solani TaxID=3028615 RepID=UPI0025AED3D5|nr:hypothetical protein [Amycolatopsis sp. MEP2-6]
MSSPRGDDETRCDEASRVTEVTSRVRGLLDGSDRRLGRAEELLAGSARRIELSQSRLVSE